MNRKSFYWLLLPALLLPGIVRAQTNLAAITTLNYQVATQLAPSVRDWTYQEAQAIAIDGLFKPPAVTADIKVHFQGQPLGTPEIKALLFISLFQAVQLTGASVKSLHDQVNAHTQARINALIAQANAAKAASPHRMISEDTSPNRMVPAGGGSSSPPPLPDDTIAFNQLIHSQQQARATLGKLSVALKKLSAEASIIGDAKLTDLK